MRFFDVIYSSLPCTALIDFNTPNIGEQHISHVSSIFKHLFILVMCCRHYPFLALRLSFLPCAYLEQSCANFALTSLLLLYVLHAWTCFPSTTYLARHHPRRPSSLDDSQTWNTPSAATLKNAAPLSKNVPSSQPVATSSASHAPTHYISPSPFPVTYGLVQCATTNSRIRMTPSWRC